MAEAYFGRRRKRGALSRGLSGPGRGLPSARNGLSGPGRGLVTLCGRLVAQRQDVAAVRGTFMDVTSYPEHLQQLLRPATDFPYHALDLFAGCGGLSLGFEAQGIDTTGFELDAYAAATYNANLHGHCHVRRLTAAVDYLDALSRPVDLLIGGPPCQPFSVGGHQRGLDDSRDGFPAFLGAAAVLRPRLVLFENVRGMLYANKGYLDQILTELRSLGYTVDARLFNVVHYGVPQNRERVIVVGHQGGFRFPTPQAKRVTAGEAVGDTMTYLLDESKLLTASQDRYVLNYEIASKCVNPRDLYPDRPARTVTCRNLAAATGDMHRVRLPDGRRRRLLVREAARLQSFPDWFTFQGPEAKQFYQIGNAVPPLFAYQLAGAVRAALDETMLSTAPAFFLNAAAAASHQLSLF